jgi:hypothetical protein
MDSDKIEIENTLSNIEDALSNVYTNNLPVELLENSLRQSTGSLTLVEDSVEQAPDEFMLRLDLSLNNDKEKDNNEAPNEIQLDGAGND